MKKGVTKKQAIVRLILIIVLAIVLFFAAFKLGSFVLGNLFGGNNVVEVPMLIGVEQEEARKMLEDRNLVMKIGVSVESEYPAGFVAKQSYAEGYTLKEGAEVEVNISKGDKVVLVPDVTDSTVDAAKIEIEQRGLVFNMEEKYDKTVPSGDIISQDPKVNSEVSTGSIVTVYVSKGVESGLVIVPNVVGETEEDASKKISDSKLIPEVTTISNEAKKNGEVVSQIPEKDAVVSELSTVVIVVNRLEEKEDNNQVDNKENENKNDDNPLTNNKKRTIKVDLSNRGERETFTVKVVVQSTVLGTRVEYEGTHSRSDGSIDVQVTDAPGAMLRLYIDGKLESEQVL